MGAKDPMFFNQLQGVLGLVLVVVSLIVASAVLRIACDRIAADIGMHILACLNLRADRQHATRRTP